MATKPRLFENGYYYHIFNRGIEKRNIFLSDRDYNRFLKTIRICNDPSTLRFNILPNLSINSKDLKNNYVSVINFVLMPNHYHFTLKQLNNNGITQFLQRLGTSYSKYFNVKNKRTGRLFEYTYKAVPVESEEQLIHLSRYIHLNPILAGLAKYINDYSWSSYSAYMGHPNYDFCNPKPVLSSFVSSKSYERFVLDQVDYAKKLKEIENLTVDFEATP